MKNESLKEDIMKKSNIYYIAQIAVLKTDLSADVKREVLRELIAREDLEAFCERQAEKEKENNDE